MDTINIYGSDCLRLYLINSPLVRAETLKFSNDGLRLVQRDVFEKWYGAYGLLVQSTFRIAKEGRNFEIDFNDVNISNTMDRWILANCNHLVKFIREEMAAYRLYTVVPRLVSFIDDFANWYIRLNRKRLKGNVNENEEQRSLSTLFRVLFTLVRIMAPFTPFFTENLYQNLKLLLPESERLESVHYSTFPDFDPNLLDEDIVRAVSRMQKVIELVRAARTKKKETLQIPIKYINNLS